MVRAASTTPSSTLPRSATTQECPLSTLHLPRLSHLRRTLNFRATSQPNDVVRSKGQRVLSGPVESILFVSALAVDGFQVPLTLCFYSCLPRVECPALELFCYSQRSLQSERANFQQFHQLIAIRIMRCADRSGVIACNLFSLCFQASMPITQGLGLCGAGFLHICVCIYICTIKSSNDVWSIFFLISILFLNLQRTIIIPRRCSN